VAYDGGGWRQQTLEPPFWKSLVWFWLIDET
jgi:hypothetical protein